MLCRGLILANIFFSYDIFEKKLFNRPEKKIKNGPDSLALRTTSAQCSMTDATTDKVQTNDTYLIQHPSKKITRHSLKKVKAEFSERHSD